MSKCHLCEKHCNKKTAEFDRCAARIRHHYQHFCNEYLRLFCLKHDFDYEEAKASWVADEVGEIVTVGDFTFSMTTIRTDIDQEAPESELLQWHDYCLETYTLGLPSCNFHSWLRGCPRISEEKLVHFRELHARKEQVEQVLKEEIREYKEQFNMGYHQHLLQMLL